MIIINYLKPYNNNINPPFINNNISNNQPQKNNYPMNGPLVNNENN